MLFKLSFIYITIIYHVLLANSRGFGVLGFWGFGVLGAITISCASRMLQNRMPAHFKPAQSLDEPIAWRPGEGLQERSCIQMNSGRRKRIDGDKEEREENPPAKNPPKTAPVDLRRVSKDHPRESTAPQPAIR